MGLKDVFDKAAQTIFTAAGDVPKTTYYYSHATAVYDIQTGDVSANASAIVVSMVFDTYSAKEKESNSIAPTDVKAIVVQSELGVVPTHKDHLFVIEASTSTRFDVVDKMKDPADATWELQLRKP